MPRKWAVGLVLVGGCFSFATVVAPPAPGAPPDVKIECTTSFVAPITDIVIATTEIIVASQTEGYDRIFVGPILLLSGIVTFFSAASGYGDVRACRRAKRGAAAAQEEALALARAHRDQRRMQALREQAWTITQRAATDARDERCEDVQRASLRVLQLDTDFHDTVFARDIAIARCLAP